MGFKKYTQSESSPKLEEREEVELPEKQPEKPVPDEKRPY